MLSYVYFGTNDLGKATTFYDATLAPLGMQRCFTNDPDWDRISAGSGLLRGVRARSRWQQGGRRMSWTLRTERAMTLIPRVVSLAADQGLLHA
jgi:hypothetical protein